MTEKINSGTGVSLWILSSNIIHTFTIINRPTQQQDVVATSKQHLSVPPSSVTGTSQMKHRTTSCWNVTKTSQYYISLTSHQYASLTSQTSLKWNTQWRLSGTSPRRVSGRHFRPKLVHWNESVYCTPINRALKMQRGVVQFSTTNHSWVMKGFVKSIPPFFGQNKYKNIRRFSTIFRHKTRIFNTTRLHVMNKYV